MMNKINLLEMLKKIKIGELFIDLFGFAGLTMVFYGLYMWKPFLAWTIVGTVIFVLSLLIGAKR